MTESRPSGWWDHQPDCIPYVNEDWFIPVQSLRFGRAAWGHSPHSFPSLSLLQAPTTLILQPIGILSIFLLICKKFTYSWQKMFFLYFRIYSCIKRHVCGNQDNYKPDRLPLCCYTVNYNLNTDIPNLSRIYQLRNVTYLIIYIIAQSYFFQLLCVNYLVFKSIRIKLGWFNIDLFKSRPL